MSNDAVIKELLKAVNDQKEGLGIKPRSTWVTNGIFKDVDDKGFFNINTVCDFSSFALALGLLISKEESFNDACDQLGIKEKYTWNGYTVEEWKEDFITRINTVKYSAKKKKLDITQKKLKSLVSEEARTEMELDEIKASLGI
jgi:hypothetical protein